MPYDPINVKLTQHLDQSEVWTGQNLGWAKLQNYRPIYTLVHKIYTRIEA